ncbi:ParB N-terminal domain-containing protein [Ralstonia sp. ASV6]|uniref:ParB/RepB/Spo0J family partition protein n=1 Tax=Ralstonia sp. ASV6 TaxID=2795124 RepID=UPI0018EDE303|nr:ParB N-terminal domain-containing protein [Ralstonia sp. ASV6]
MTLKRRFADITGSIKVTDADRAKAETLGPQTPRTAPGQMMHLQATVERQATEIEQLRSLLNTATVMEIPLHLIDEVPGRRRKLTAEAYAELKANLSQNALAQAITVRRKSDGRYELLAGHNRTEIYRELGRESIRGEVIEGVDDKDAHLLGFWSNLLAPSLSDFEKFWNFRQLQLETGLSQAKLAEISGLSTTHVSRIMAFEKLPERSKELLAENPTKLGSTAAEQLCKLAEKEGGEERVNAAIEKLLSDSAVTQEQAVALARPEPPKKAATPQKNELVVKDGKRNFCSIVTRKNVLGLTFPKGITREESERWAAKIQEFISRELKQEQSEKS